MSAGVLNRHSSRLATACQAGGMVTPSTLKRVFPVVAKAGRETTLRLPTGTGLGVDRDRGLAYSHTLLGR
jgi:hypothetical protein